jgi:hypothetical protein
MSQPRRTAGPRFLLPVLAALVAVGAAWWALRSPVPAPGTVPDAGPAPEEKARQEDALTARWALSPADAAPGHLSGRVLARGSVEGTRVTVARVLAGPLRGPRRLPEVHAVGVGAEGAFDVGPLAPGVYAVSAAGPAGAAGPRVVELTSGARETAELTFAPGTVTLRGQVRGGSGGALAGAIVTAQALSLAASDEALALYQVETDAGGAYALHVPPGLYEVLVRAAEHAPDRAALVVAGDSAHDVEARPAARLGGRVSTATAGRRPEGAWVQVVGGAAALTAPEARADATGAFALEGLEPGQVQLLVRWGDQVGLSAPVAAVAGERVEADVALTPGRTVSGRVVDVAGKPVAGAVVRLSAAEPLVPLDEVARTDAAGAFRFEGLLEGGYGVEALGAGGARAARPLVVAGSAPGRVELALEPGGTLEGTVTAAGGAPAAGARVRLDVVAGPDTGAPARLALADERGRFRFEGVPAGQVTLAAVHALGAARSAAQPVGPGQQASVALTLEAPAAVEGRVVGADGKPVAGVPVVAVAEEQGVTPAVALSGADGRYRLAPLAAGAQRVVLVAGGRWRPGFAEAERAVTARAGETVSGVDLALPRAPGRLSGTVVGPDGQPVTGAAVVVRPASAGARPPGPFEGHQALTGAGGRFSLEAPGALRCTAWASHPRHAAAAGVEVDCAAEKVVLRLAGGTRLAGDVRGADGTPAPEYTLTAVRLAEGREGPPVEAVSVRVRAADGGFDVGPLAPGRYTLLARTADGRSGQSLVEFGAGARAAPGRVSVKLGPAPRR